MSEKLIKLVYDKNEIYSFSVREMEVSHQYLNLIPSNDSDKIIIEEAQSQASPYTQHNLMLIKNPNFIALIDTGFPDSIDTLSQILKDIEVELKDITHIILTHAHGDHVGALIHNPNIFPNAKILIDKHEYNYWINGEIAQRHMPVRATLKNLRNVEFFDHTQDLICKDSGIKAVPAYGHTPGHNVIVINDKIVYWADLLHAFEAQIKNPKIAIGYDIDSHAAIQERERLLQEFRVKNLRVVGTHTPFTNPIALL